MSDLTSSPASNDAAENPNALPSAYDPKVAESHWYAVWEKAGYFAPEATSKADAPHFSIVIPPPNVTGSLHMGHALTTTLEDILIRWNRMLGKRTLWVPGTDHAGIATQMVVERDLKKLENKSRHDLGREKFLERVWEWKHTYGGRITEQLRVLGCSLDWSREHFTMDDKLSVAVREVFVRLFEEGLMYRAERLVNWCPRCQTALSDLEVEHEEAHKGSLFSFAYPLADGSGELVVATTRPETMLGDTGIAVHPDDPRYQHLIGKHVRHPILGYSIPIVGDAILVDPTFGTGAVKVTPAHDFNDFETGKRHHLDLFNIFDTNAKVLADPEAPDALKTKVDMQAWGTYAGLDRNAARTKVKEALEALGLTRGEKDHILPLGRCQRCNTVVEPSLSVQWWVKTEPLAKPALEAVKSGKTKIIPDTWNKTYFHWMENIQDWCVSRQLWWGHRIPAWYCTSCDAPKGSGDNLRFNARAQPIVARSEPKEPCPRCKKTGTYVQDADVLDTWFSSALWPFSTLGWPEKTADLKTFYPISVMETGFDILFFWVARMMMMGCKFMGEPPFPVIYLHAMVRDKNGDKMSKTKGNVIDPLHLVYGCTAEEISSQFKGEYPEGFPAFGADALRFTLASMSQSGRDIKLSIERIAGYRGFANKIWNAARFALMRVEGTPAAVETMRPHLEAADTWVLSRLAACAREVDDALQAYRFSDAASATYQFFWIEFCDWYIELAKPRLLSEGSDTNQSKKAAESTLVYVLDHALRLLHPFMPFITEEIWQKLPLAHRDAASIMVAPYSHPKKLEMWTNAAVEERYKLVQEAIVTTRTLRMESNVSPAKFLDVHVGVRTPAQQAVLENHRSEIITLARLSSLHLHIGEPPKLPEAADRVAEQVHVVVSLAGLINYAEEAARLRKTIEKTTVDRDKIAAKLQNENFVSRAPAEILAKDRARVAELNDMLTKMAESLTRLDSASRLRSS